MDYITDTNFRLKFHVNFNFTGNWVTWILLINKNIKEEEVKWEKYDTMQRKSNKISDTKNGNVVDISLLREPAEDTDERKEDIKYCRTNDGSNIKQGAVEGS